MHEAPRPIIDLSSILVMCQVPREYAGEKRAMVNMLEEFVRMTAIQLGSLRNSLITDQHDMLFSGTEVTPNPNPNRNTLQWHRGHQLRRPNPSPDPNPNPNP
eukprot:scaffold47656_cov36-Phaeocystis_antarctica.AAC.1